VAQRLVGHLEAQLRGRDKLQIDRMQRFFPLAKELSDDEDGLALLAMLLDDAYHEWMHTPPELPQSESQPATKKTQPRKGKSRYRKGGQKKNSSKTSAKQ
jgi:ATP-dependent RNA helicase DeaD